MDVLIKALQRTGVRILTLSIIFFFSGLVLIYFLLLAQLTGIIFVIWGFAISMELFAILVLYQALSYLRAKTNSFLKVIAENPGTISDIYTSAEPSTYTMYGEWHGKRFTDYFNITIKLANNKLKIVSVHQKFFKPVLEYIISVAPQAKVHN